MSFSNSTFSQNLLHQSMSQQIEHKFCVQGLSCSVQKYLFYRFTAPCELPERSRRPGLAADRSTAAPGPRLHHQCPASCVPYQRSSIDAGRRPCDALLVAARSRRDTPAPCTAHRFVDRLLPVCWPQCLNSLADEHGKSSHPICLPRAMTRPCRGLYSAWRRPSQVAELPASVLLLPEVSFPARSLPL